MAKSFKVKNKSDLYFATVNPLFRPASKPITRHLIVSAQPVLPTPTKNADSTSSSGPSYKNPPRQVYPPERLKHRFLPYGSHLKLSDEELDVMDVDVDVQADKLDQDKPPETSADSPDKTTRKKKRKGEGDPSGVKAKKPKKSR